MRASSTGTVRKSFTPFLLKFEIGYKCKCINSLCRRFLTIAFNSTMVLNNI